MDKACFLKVACLPQIGCKPLRLPMDHDSFAPFVEAIFEAPADNGVMRLTVGNESYRDRPNTAIIKSMEYGFMDKPQAKLEIVDEAGGEMGLLVDVLRKCGKELRTSQILLKFGWVKANCEGFSEEDRVTFEGFIKMTIVQIDVSYGEGLVKYTIEGNAVDVVTTNQREDDTMGPGMRLVDAIGRICASKEITPVYASVQADGTVKVADSWPAGLSPAEAPWEWEKFGTDGPRGSWQGDNNDVLSTISRWIEPYRIKHGREGAGILMAFDSKNHKRLFLWKDPKSEKRCPSNEVSQQQAAGSANTASAGEKRGSLGTFIVNGGKCSPVIRFDPKFNFISALAKRSTGGTASGAENSKNEQPENEEKTDPRCPADQENTGPENDATIYQHAKENYPPNTVHKETLRSNMAHIKANMMTEFQIAPIQADMTIMGIPTDDFVDFRKFLFAPLSIIVINPFFISGMANDGCGDWSWLAKSGCNEILSDKNYLCQGVNHSIKEGSYTTTLKVLNVNKTKVDNLD